MQYLLTLTSKQILPFGFAEQNTTAYKYKPLAPNTVRVIRYLIETESNNMSVNLNVNYIHLLGSATSIFFYICYK